MFPCFQSRFPRILIFGKLHIKKNTIPQNILVRIKTKTKQEDFESKVHTRFVLHVQQVQIKLFTHFKFAAI